MVLKKIKREKTACANASRILSVSITEIKTEVNLFKLERPLLDLLAKASVE